MTTRRSSDQTPKEAGAFSDAVMAVVAREPRPTPTSTLIAALRRGALRDASAAVLTAWHLGTWRGWQIAPGVRMRSLALVFSVIAVLGISGSLAAAGAVRVVEQATANEQGPVENDQSGADEDGAVENLDPQAPTDGGADGNQVQESGRSGDGSSDDGGDVDDDADLMQRAPDEDGSVENDDGQTGANEPGGQGDDGWTQNADEQTGVDQSGSRDDEDQSGDGPRSGNDGAGGDQPDGSHEGGEHDPGSGDGDQGGGEQSDSGDGP
jgi:hypothetical protein